MNKGIIITNLVISILTLLIFISTIITVYILIKQILPDITDEIDKINTQLTRIEKE